MFDADFDLLPQNATPLERGLARGTRRLIEVPTPIRPAFRPYEAPASVLPYLAWERSVDIWHDDWPDALKRSVTARAFALHKRKGTAYVLREYARYVGATITDIVVPPKKVFSGPSLTREQREAWLSRLPQVRTWRIREAGIAPAWKSFHGGHHHAHFAETAKPVPSTALERLRRRARWVVGGVETDVRVSDFGGPFRLHLAGAAGAKVFAGDRPRASRFYVPSDAWRRLVTIAPAARLPWRSPTGPQLEAVTSEPERVRVSGTRGRSVFSDAPCGQFFVPSTAPMRVFERYAVTDGSAEQRRPAIQIMGVGRYGFPAHTAHVTASVPGQRSPLAAGEGVVAPRLRFWLPSGAAERVERLCHAARAAKRLSDRILLKTGPTLKFVAGHHFLAGDAHVVGLPN